MDIYKEKTTIAIFDFDKTLIKCDSMFLINKILNTRLKRLKNYLFFSPYFLLYLLKIKNLKFIKEKFFNLILKKLLFRSKESIKEFFNNNFYFILKSKINKDADKCLKWHLNNNHKVIIISASPRIFIQSIADDYGVELIATECELVSTYYKNKIFNKFIIRSNNCKGLEKVNRLKDLLKQPLNKFFIYAYGDSEGDKEILNISDHPHWRDFSKEIKPFPNN